MQVRILLAVANLNSSAVHLYARDLRNLRTRAFALCGKRQLCVGFGRSLDFADTFFTDTFCPTLNLFARDLEFRQRFQVLGRSHKRRRLRTGVRHLPQHGRRERTTDFNADCPGQRGKKPCGSKGKSIPARRSSSARAA